MSAEPPPPPPPRHRPRLVLRAARWGAELATVFVGVYAAFMLNDHQAHRQERARREQILAWMEADFSETLQDVKRAQIDAQRQSDSFARRITAGEMPAVRAFTFDSDYDPSDTASVLSSGGFELLEVETVRQIRAAEGTLRLMVGRARHDQQLSDALILPNLEKDTSFFYDPATHKLRPTYRWYTDYFPRVIHDYGELRPELEKLVAQIRSERQRNR